VKRPAQTLALWMSLAVAALAGGCTSVEYVRIRPGTMRVSGGEPIAAVQVSREGFYFLGIPFADCDLDTVLNQLLIDAARKVGADRVVDVRFDVTPSTGVWWFFTHFLPIPPSARAWGIAIKDGTPPGPPAAAGAAP
jgi:hypothetical protein